MNPVFIQGGSYIDVRGAMRFCNDFDMSMVRRFYTIANSSGLPVRGWIGHKKETKWFFPMKGVTAIDVEPMDDNRVERAEGVVGSRAERADRVDCAEAESNDSTCSTRSTRLKKYVLDANTPSVLKVPPGNWFCIKQDGNAEVMVFSNCKVGEFKDDDFRRPCE